MTLVLSTRDIDRVESAGRALALPVPGSLDTWWTDVSTQLLALFAADHAMCALPGAAMLATNIDASTTATLGKLYALPAHELRRLDPMLCELEAAYGPRPRAVWSRLGTLRRLDAPGRRSAVLHDVFERTHVADSINVDLVTDAGPARLCLSFDRPNRRTEHALSLARLLVPAFEAGARALGSHGERADHGLTSRELEVARLLALRLRNREIAARLQISEHTVRHHIESVFAKLGVRSRHDVAARLERR